MLNGQKYEDIMRKIAERSRKAKWAREHRAKGGGNAKPEVGQESVRKLVDDGTPLNEDVKF